MKTQKIKIILDEIYDFERPSGYIPLGFCSVEDEIRNICNNNNIIVSSIVKCDKYKVYGKKISKKKFNKLK